MFSLKIFSPHRFSFLNSFLVVISYGPRHEVMRFKACTGSILVGEKFSAVNGIDDNTESYGFWSLTFSMVLQPLK